MEWAEEGFQQSAFSRQREVNLGRAIHVFLLRMDEDGRMINRQGGKMAQASNLRHAEPRPCRLREIDRAGVFWQHADGLEGLI